MAIYGDGPTRPGNRGGWDQFKWDDVKDQDWKHREMYLGVSVHLLPNWHQKDGFRSTTVQGAGSRVDVSTDELDAVRRADEDAMAEALGLAPQTKMTERDLDRRDMKETLARGAIERGRFDVDRIEGVGFAVAAAPSASVVDRLPGTMPPEREPEPAAPVPTPNPVPVEEKKDEKRKRENEDGEERKKRHRHRHKHTHREHRKHKHRRDRKH